MSRKYKIYTGEFKQRVVEDMLHNKLGYTETERKYSLPNSRVIKWERIYLEEGPGGLSIERRGRATKQDNPNKGRPPTLDKKVEEDLIAEVQRLRMENAYLKKLNALVREREISEHKKKLK